MSMYNSKKFNELVYQHLSKIKSENILVYDEKHIKYKNMPYMYNEKPKYYIFPNEVCDFYHQNKICSKYSYLPTYRNDIIQYLKENTRIELHKGQRHLNSSQGIVLNFLVPIIVENLECEFTKEVFGIEGNITIEHTMEDDGGTGRGTEVDFSILEGDKLHLFEAKFTESNFGTVSINTKNKEYDINKYRAKWNGTSYGMINQSSKIVCYSKVEKYFKELTCDRYDNDNKLLPKSNQFTYFDSYQLIRNFYNTLFKLHENQIVKRNNIGTMNVLISERHQTQTQEFLHFKKQLVDNRLVQLNYWESLCERAILFSENQQNSKLKEHYQLFKEVFLDFEN